jgi:hypothetical protein
VVHFGGANGSVIFTSLGDGSVKDGEDQGGRVASTAEVPECEAGFGEGISLIRAQGDNSEHKAIDKAKRNPRGVRRMWRYVEVMIKGFFKQGGMDTAVNEG